ncbi:MFS transporter [Streptomyces sp. NPDC079167]|uniref:MFS transporter n=1 Tax=Streptomyces sp. NPDC079167 TaxID=3154513 RepID=UPI00343DB56E
MTATRRRVTLAASVLGAAIVALDGTVLTVVQPTLQKDLHATVEQVQWTSTAYLIAVAGLLVLSGRIGDRFGHRRVFAVGMLGFGAASAGIGLATGIGWVIALRVAQGVFGALLQPATLGMLRAAFPPDRLGMPLALRTAAIGVAAAAGPLAGGALAAGHGWRAVFFLNVAPATAGGLAVLAVRDTGPRAASREAGAWAAPREARTVAALDLPGALLLAGALACGVLALTEGPWGGGAEGRCAPPPQWRPSPPDGPSYGMSAVPGTRWCRSACSGGQRSSRGSPSWASRRARSPRPCSRASTTFRTSADSTPSRAPWRRCPARPRWPWPLPSP